VAGKAESKNRNSDGAGGALVRWGAGLKPATWSCCWLLPCVVPCGVSRDKSCLAGETAAVQRRRVCQLVEPLRSRVLARDNGVMCVEKANPLDPSAPSPSLRRGTRTLGATPPALGSTMLKAVEGECETEQADALRACRIGFGGVDEQEVWDPGSKN
jgi:hypothetical protein